MLSGEQRDARQKAAQEARRRRVELRQRLAPLASLTRVRRCGEPVSRGGVTIGVKANPDGTRHAAIGGLGTCASVWSCPVCGPKIATGRASELADVIRTVDDMGGSAHMVTLTMRHTSRDRLGWTRPQRRQATRLTDRLRDHRRRVEAGYDLTDAEHAQAETDRQGLDALALERGVWDAVSDGWAAVTSGRRWVADQQAHGGLLGWVRVVEVTHSRNGWHCHVHSLLCFADDVSEEDVRPIVARMFQRWKRALEKTGHDASGDLAQDGKIPGWDVRRADLHDNAMARYFTKLAHEITSAHRKQTRRPGGRTPTMLMVEALETYRVEHLARLHEWEQASEGRRMMTWSTGNRDLRRLAELGPERTDDELAAEETDPDARIGLAPEVWGWCVANDHTCTVREVAEDHGLPGLVAWLADHGQDVVTGPGLGWTDAVAGTGQGWQKATPAILRRHRPDGTALKRPSDRPPRHTDEAWAAVSADPWDVDTYRRDHPRQ